MASSGTRTSSRSRWPSGLTNAWTTTSAGRSWAAGRPAHDQQRRRGRATMRISTRERMANSAAQGWRPVICIAAGGFAHMAATACVPFSEALFLVALRVVAASSSRARLRTHRLGTARRRRAGAHLRGRSAVAQAAAQSLGARPDDRRRRRCAGPRLDRASWRREPQHHDGGQQHAGADLDDDERSAVADVAGREPRRHRHRRAGLPDHRRGADSSRPPATSPSTSPARRR